MILDLAIIDKRRPQANVTEVMNVIGDVEGKTCIIVDDIVDTAGTLCTAAEALKAEGAKEVVCYITHAVFSGPAIERIAASKLDRMVVTDTIPLSPEAQACSKILSVKFRPLTRRVHPAGEQRRIHQRDVSIAEATRALGAKGPADWSQISRATTIKTLEIQDVR